MTTSEIAAEHGVSRQSIHTYRRTGAFPRPVEGEGSTRPRFRADEVAAFFAANPKQPGKKRSSPPQQQGEPVTTTVDPRTEILSDLCHPEWNPVSESHGLSHDDAVKLVDAYRAKVLRLEADAIEQEFLDGITDSDRDQTWNAAVKAIATKLRQSAGESEE